MLVHRRGHQFLAGAVLPDDEHVGVGRRRRPRQAERVTHACDRDTSVPKVSAPGSSSARVLSSAPRHAAPAPRRRCSINDGRVDRLLQQRERALAEDSTASATVACRVTMSTGAWPRRHGNDATSRARTRRAAPARATPHAAATGATGPPRWRPLAPVAGVTLRFEGRDHGVVFGNSGSTTSTRVSGRVTIDRASSGRRPQVGDTSGRRSSGSTVLAPGSRSRSATTDRVASDVPRAHHTDADGHCRLYAPPTTRCLLRRHARDCARVPR